MPYAFVHNFLIEMEAIHIKRALAPLWYSQVALFRGKIAGLSYNEAVASALVVRDTPCILTNLMVSL